jgi:hypothetical protein
MKKSILSLAYDQLTLIAAENFYSRRDPQANLIYITAMPGMNQALTEE